MAGGNPWEKTLKETPTWAVAVVCTVIILVSVIMEHIIEHLHKVFQKRQKKAMLEALEKIKSGLSGVTAHRLTPLRDRGRISPANSAYHIQQVFTMNTVKSSGRSENKGLF